MRKLVLHTVDLDMTCNSLPPLSSCVRTAPWWEQDCPRALGGHATIPCPLDSGFLTTVIQKPRVRPVKLLAVKLDTPMLQIAINSSSPVWALVSFKVQPQAVNQFPVPTWMWVPGFRTTVKGSALEKRVESVAPLVFTCQGGDHSWNAQQMVLSLDHCPVASAILVQIPLLRIRVWNQISAMDLQLDKTVQWRASPDSLPILQPWCVIPQASWVELCRHAPPWLAQQALCCRTHLLCILATKSVSTEAVL